ncbi:MAG: hypothetical protein QOC62_2541 [Mycobacterium sp.]|nr:hypothetical protein [Mycobacterium sp.]
MLCGLGGRADCALSVTTRRAAVATFTLGAKGVAVGGRAVGRHPARRSGLRWRPGQNIAASRGIEWMSSVMTRRCRISKAPKREDLTRRKRKD